VREDLIRWLSTKDAITPAEFRDQYQTSRKYVIPLLEYFDREGVTVRMGEVRRLKRPRLTETA
jgi:selenocysteine-specific elongation factor